MGKRVRKPWPIARGRGVYSPFTIYHLQKFGGQGRIRTADAGLFRAALYQLSYLAVG
jgi:hypothetical protein